MKKMRLRMWVKVVLVVIVMIPSIMFIKYLNDVSDYKINNMYEKCDNDKGYTCSYYEARTYSMRGE